MILSLQYSLYCTLYSIQCLFSDDPHNWGKKPGYILCTSIQKCSWKLPRCHCAVHISPFRPKQGSFYVVCGGICGNTGSIVRLTYPLSGLSGALSTSFVVAYAVHKYQSMARMSDSSCSLDSRLWHLLNTHVLVLIQ
ncbi:hypothetical protein HAX54_003207 [Datura stramonium]|uniref:Uncharacterized protein n=1 Tax=Datura stramonium TaxID=4076 RepID=A0ABS8WVW0_DATST|nr:hypothetical protein [Datura stramonium]